MLLKNFRHYWELMRFHKPIGIYLLLWPTLWALWAAKKSLPPLWPTLVVFVLGTVLMRAAGCVINDIADRHFDHQVQRTKTRPLTSGKVSVTSAIILFLLLSFVAFGLVLFLNSLTIYLSFVGIGLACIYPFTKRFFSAPQLVLGVAFAWGIPMAYAAVINYLPIYCWWLFGVTILLIVAYDTMYAMVDKEDDLKLHLKSTAILFGEYDRLIIGILQLIIFLNLFLFGWIQDYHFFYFIFIFLAGMLLVYQQYLIKNRIRENCFQAFLNNHWFGLLVLFGFMFGV